MRLLILTQKVDKSDPVLGFFHRWIVEFSKLYESLIVICLEKGEYDLPQNVRVLSLGKEIQKSKIQYIRNFYKYIRVERSNYDAVFVHMNPEYVILGGLLWKSWGKKIGLWYVHRAKNFRIWLAEKFADIIFSSVPESFRIKSEKVVFLGHGIDTERFAYEPYIAGNKKLVSIGRITPIKHCEILIEAAAVLDGEDPGWRVKFIGSPHKVSDLRYKNALLSKIEMLELKNSITFAGNRLVDGNDFHNLFASVNMTPTGGMDKAVLESLAAGCPVFTSNNAFREIFGEYADIFMFEFGNAYDLAKKIKGFRLNSRKETIVDNLSGMVRKEYDVSNIVKKISEIIQN